MRHLPLQHHLIFRFKLFFELDFLFGIIFHHLSLLSCKLFSKVLQLLLIILLKLQSLLVKRLRQFVNLFCEFFLHFHLLYRHVPLKLCFLRSRHFVPLHLPASKFPQNVLHFPLEIHLKGGPLSFKDVQKLFLQCFLVILVQVYLELESLDKVDVGFVATLARIIELSKATVFAAPHATLNCTMPVHFSCRLTAC